MAYRVIELGNKFWTIEDGDVRMYLMDGGEEALLLDTGFGSGDLGHFVSAYVSGPVTVVNTHSHGDHTGGNHFFKSFCMHERDSREILPACGPDPQVRFVADGDEITAGEISLKVVEIPGHTPGSIALLDERNRRIFTADSIARNYPVYMQFPGQSLICYSNALHRIRSLRDYYDTMYPCHGELRISMQDLENEIGCVHGILEGKLEAGKARNSEGRLERAYYYGNAIVFH